MCYACLLDPVLHNCPEVDYALQTYLTYVPIAKEKNSAHKVQGCEPMVNHKRNIHRTQKCISLVQTIGLLCTHICQCCGPICV